METEFDIKVCPFCNETIKTRAKKCPHCQSWQSKWLGYQGHPVGILVAVLFPMAMVLVFYNQMIFKERPKFTAYQNQIQIRDTQMVHSEQKDCSIITTLGQIKNTTSITWTDVSIEVQYFNAAGQMVDTGSERTYGLVLQPNTEQAFRVRFCATKAPSDYVNQKVFVRYAEAADRWP